MFVRIFIILSITLGYLEAQSAQYQMALLQQKVEQLSERVEGLTTIIEGLNVSISQIKESKNEANNSKQVAMEKKMMEEMGLTRCDLHKKAIKHLYKSMTLMD